MTPEDEADFREIILRLQAAQEIQHARLLALGKCLDEFGLGVGLQLQGGQTTSSFVKQEAVRLVGEKLRHLADDDIALASCLKDLLDEYEKS